MMKSIGQKFHWWVQSRYPGSFLLISSSSLVFDVLDARPISSTANGVLWHFASWKCMFRTLGLAAHNSSEKDDRNKLRSAATWIVAIAFVGSAQSSWFVFLIAFFLWRPGFRCISEATWTINDLLCFWLFEKARRVWSYSVWFILWCVVDRESRQSVIVFGLVYLAVRC